MTEYIAFEIKDVTRKKKEMEEPVAESYKGLKRIQKRNIQNVC